MVRKKKAKYKKTHLEAWKCSDCTFEWCYRTARCPICSAVGQIKII
ncbi:MAG: hypothetical protein HYY37_05125 [Candidatus Aenigmarchaeota archaeon]|nr:hypothetical protein [Candidatus Aenigmarchaeota archaeon]